MSLLHLLNSPFNLATTMIKLQQAVLGTEYVVYLVLIIVAETSDFKKFLGL